MSQQHNACPIESHQEYLDINPQTTIEELHHHYKCTLLPQIQERGEYEVFAVSASQDPVLLWNRLHGGEKTYLPVTMMSVEGKVFSCPDSFLHNKRFKTITKHQLAEIIVLAIEAEIK